VSDVLSGAIPPGGTARAQTKASPPLDRADTSGYFGAAGAASGAQLGLTLGIVECGADLCADSSKDAGASAIAVFQPSTLPDTQTLYLIGDPASTVHPVEGLLVEDDQAAGDGPDGGVDWQLLARSTLTTPATITVDTFDVELAGLTTPSDSVRSSYIASAIAAAQSDVVCVTEIPFDRDKRVIASAALPKNGGNFGYSYYLASDLTTPPTSALTWSGATPATLMTSACASSTDALRALAGCAASSCVAGGGSGIDGGAFPGSPIVSASCLEARCLNEVASLISSDPVCTDCAMLYLVSGYDVSTMYDECGSDAQDPYGQFEYAGMNGTMILSRYPFARNRVGEDDTSAYLFPGSSFRRAALRANVQLDSSTTIDVYCAELTSPPGGWSVLTYTGLYASPDAGLYADEVSDDDGWRDERSLQARDLVDWVKSQSQGAPAVLAGEWNAGLAESKGDSGTPLLAASDPEVLRRFLDAGWVPAHPADHTTACTRCNGNPYQAGAPVTADGTLGVDTTTTFLLGFPASATIYETIWDVGVGDIPAITGMDGGPFPLSPDYPRRVQILRP
jgi:hypothetical protein